MTEENQDHNYPAVTHLNWHTAL